MKGGGTGKRGGPGLMMLLKRLLCLALVLVRSGFATAGDWGGSHTFAAGAGRALTPRVDSVRGGWWMFGDKGGVAGGTKGGSVGRTGDGSVLDPRDLHPLSSKCTVAKAIRIANAAQVLPLSHISFHGSSSTPTSHTFPSVCLSLWCWRGFESRSDASAQRSDVASAQRRTTRISLTAFTQTAGAGRPGKGAYVDWQCCRNHLWTFAKRCWANDGRRDHQHLRGQPA